MLKSHTHLPRKVIYWRPLIIHKVLRCIKIEVFFFLNNACIDRCALIDTSQKTSKNTSVLSLDKSRKFFFNLKISHQRSLKTNAAILDSKRHFCCFFRYWWSLLYRLIESYSWISKPDSGVTCGLSLCNFVHLRFKNCCLREGGGIPLHTVTCLQLFEIGDALLILICLLWRNNKFSRYFIITFFLVLKALNRISFMCECQ